MAAAEVDITVGELVPGDLVFCYRKGIGYATLGNIAKEPWRHVGIVVDTNGVLNVEFVQVYGNRFKRTPLEDFFKENDRIGYARMNRPADCIDRVVKWTKEQTSNPHMYAFDDLFLAGVIAFAHTKVTPSNRRRLISMIAAAYEETKDRPTGSDAESYTCSGFIDHAFRHAGCRLDYDRWRQSSGTPQRRTRRPMDEYLRSTPSSVLASYRLPDDTTMLDLYYASPPRLRSAHGARANRTQVATFCVTLVAAVTGVQDFDNSDYTRVKTDGRWVAPGDLWRSSSVAQRGLVYRPEGWDRVKEHKLKKKLRGSSTPPSQQTSGQQSSVSGAH